MRNRISNLRNELLVHPSIKVANRDSTDEGMLKDSVVIHINDLPVGSTLSDSSISNDVVINVKPLVFFFEIGAIYRMAFYCTSCKCMENHLKQNYWQIHKK